ncbi:MAG: alpha/beta hydrolase [Candidatus Lokiarchaeota archaeon]|nr:alpha/beta hydrolase [Candidatus Lokiarchaeota archaeon]
MVSEGMKRVIDLLKQQNEQDTKKRIEDGRKAMEQMAQMEKFPKDVNFDEINVNGIPSLWISTPEVVKEHVVLYLHGGGYVEGSRNTHKGLGYRISQVSKSRILLIDYRLAPENPYPAALEDSVAAYRWLIDIEGINPKNIVISGDSAGGGLTAATILKLRDTGVELPAGGVLLSPWTDLDITGDSVRTKRRIDPFIDAGGLFFMANLYAGDEDLKNPYISPLYADLMGLPPLLIQVGSAEVILDDSTRFAEKAKSAGVDVTLEIWEDMVHVFQAFALWAPEGEQAIEKIGEFIQKLMKE